MIFTSHSNMGDFLFSWAVASWYYKTHGEKIHWVFPAANGKNCPVERVLHYQKLNNLLSYQDFTEKISYVDAPWKPFWNPADFGIDGKYANFGIWERPYVYVSQFYADRYGYSYDPNFVIKYRNIDVPVHDDVWIETAPWRDNVGSLKQVIPPNCYQMSHGEDVEVNINIAAKAKNVWTNGGGFTILMDLCNISTIIYKTREEYELGDKPAFRWMSFPDKNYIRHRYILT